MKMVIAVVQSKDAGTLVDKLVARRYRVTRITTSGGFLRESNATLLIGVEDELVNDVVSIIRATCQTRNRYISPLPPMTEPGGDIYVPNPIEVQVGGATIFVVNVDQYLRI
ncbi:MAG: cyclic-di-AMP receptor [Chloroflexi bacterium]|uniref:Cyclic-di-AMP receptor n=1 Tax=Candidatus Chlorohelix allophototropha TaxID=3003348 RepID=A0A8T7M1Q8_9CHLR|nr:cyclic-di-AMP receptor [Chloroflexota bacterium]WJW66602.1 cyclic-di-AMP receptor [Chloroflexota bacterium L227-S17]